MIWWFSWEKRFALKLLGVKLSYLFLIILGKLKDKKREQLGKYKISYESIRKNYLDAYGLSKIRQIIAPVSRSSRQYGLFLLTNHEFMQIFCQVNTAFYKNQRWPITQRD